MATEFCSCEKDGYCLRYQREMGGRMREICAGINVDLGTAAAFREQWQREIDDEAHTTPTHAAIQPEYITLSTDQAAGDTVAMTAAIYSLHRAHPGKYATSVLSPHPKVFMYNPDVTVPTPGVRWYGSELKMHYPAIHKSNQRAIHFMQGWCEFLGQALGIDIPLLTNRPRLYFVDPTPPPTGDYWVVCSGGKIDFTNKLWGQYNYQRVVDILQGEVKFIQVGKLGAEDNHQPLTGVYNMLGRTTMRQLFDLVRSARGVLCGISLLMHVAAALEKPAVVIAGGLEPVPWNAYPLQKYLHTVGALPCYDPKGNPGGCWRPRVVPLGDSPSLDKNTCLRPVNGTPASLSKCVVPECMTLIKPAEVADEILRYNYGLRERMERSNLGRQVPAIQVGEHQVCDP